MHMGLRRLLTQRVPREHKRSKFNRVFFSYTDNHEIFSEVVIELHDETGILQMSLLYTGFLPFSQICKTCLNLTETTLYIYRYCTDCTQYP